MKIDLLISFSDCFSGGRNCASYLTGNSDI